VEYVIKFKGEFMRALFIFLILTILNTLAWAQQYTKKSDTEATAIKEIEVTENADQIKKKILINDQIIALREAENIELQAKLDELAKIGVAPADKLDAVGASETVNP
jgi:hypothetical protein